VADGKMASGPASRWMALVELASRIFFAGAAILLGLFSLGLLCVAAWELLSAVFHGETLLAPILESIGLITIAVAVFDVAKFLVEEELIAERQLRSVIEARRSLTKFFTTIIIIVVALEAIVLLFETKLNNVRELIYPTLLMAVGVFALVGLGLFQRLSAEGGSNRIGPDRAADRAHEAVANAAAGGGTDTAAPEDESRAVGQNKRSAARWPK
jgi:hypothetical protein